MSQIQKWFWPLLALVLSTSIGLILGAQKDNNNDDTTIVKTYQISPHQATQAHSALKRLFANKEHANAQAFGNGLLMVKMPKSFEDGIDEMVKNFSKENNITRRKVRMDYWVLRGSTRKLETQTNLQNLQKALTTINQTDGEQNFQLLEHLSSHSSLGMSSKVKGWLTRVESSITSSENELNLGLRFKSDFGEVDTATKLTPGQFIVVGQSAANVRKLKHILKDDFHFSSDKPTEKTDRIYYIAKATLLD